MKRQNHTHGQQATLEKRHPCLPSEPPEHQIPFPDCQWGPQRTFSGGTARVPVTISGSILGGTHDLKQQRIPTHKHFRHFNFYYNLNYVSTSLRKRKTWWPNLFFPLMSTLIFSFQGQAIGWHLACSHIWCSRHGTHDSLPPTMCIPNPIMSHFSCFRQLACGFQQPVPSTRPVLVGRKKPLLSILRSWFFFFI